MDMSGLLLPILNHEVGSNPYLVPSTGNLGEPLFLSSSEFAIGLHHPNSHNLNSSHLENPHLLN